MPRESDKRPEQLLELASAPDWVRTIGLPVWITDASGRIRYFNRQAEVFFNSSRDAKIGKPTDTAIAGRARDGRLNCPHCRALRHGRLPAELAPVRIHLPIGGKSVEVCIVVIAIDGPEDARLVHCVVDDERERRLRRFLGGVMDHIAPRGGEEAAGRVPLTQREREVLSLLAEDMNMHEIADRLSVS